MVPACCLHLLSEKQPGVKEERRACFHTTCRNSNKKATHKPYRYQTDDLRNGRAGVVVNNFPRPLSFLSSPPSSLLHTLFITADFPFGHSISIQPTHPRHHSHEGLRPPPELRVISRASSPSVRESHTAVLWGGEQQSSSTTTIH